MDRGHDPYEKRQKGKIASQSQRKSEKMKTLKNQILTENTSISRVMSSKHSSKARIAHNTLKQ